MRVELSPDLDSGNHRAGSGQRPADPSACTTAGVRTIILVKLESASGTGRWCLTVIDRIRASNRPLRLRIRDHAEGPTENSSRVGIADHVHPLAAADWCEQPVADRGRRDAGSVGRRRGAHPRCATSARPPRRGCRVGLLGRVRLFSAGRTCGQVPCVANSVAASRMVSRTRPRRRRRRTHSTTRHAASLAATGPGR